ncbi:MAG: hypothetical protein IR159_09655 [Brevundimonas sp.]|nr:hypothetical protein [Brevundimonas sp.]
MTPSQTRALLSGLSAELATLMETVDGLSSLVADHARQTPADSRSGVLVKAQAVDDLHQTLDALRALAGALSCGAPVDEALAAVPLAALAERLKAASGSAAPASGGATRAGDLVLFE